MVAHSEILLSKCAQFREQGEFIDVRLQVNEEVFSAHRIVLAASSDYFHAMFSHGVKELNQEVIELKDESVSTAALKIVLESIYTGDLQVNDENVFEVLVAADHLQVKTVVQQCCDYLQNQFVQLRFDVQTYCQICIIANRHGLTDLQEATQSKMASMYKEVCENEEFLSHIDADQLSHLLSRDDLSAPSETFVFKSVMQWIKHKKEERMPVAAKVIGAVRLGLVNIKDLIEELDTDEMQQVPEIHMLLHESLLHFARPSNSSNFAKEKAQPRSTGPVIVAILPQTHMMYFDMEERQWKQLSSLAPAADAINCFCAETVGGKLFVAIDSCIYCYDIETDKWETHKKPTGGVLKSLCTVGDYMYAVSECYVETQRYNFAKRQWHSFANGNVTSSFSNNQYYYSGATALFSKVYVLYGHNMYDLSLRCWQMQNAGVYCFDPATNVWHKKASTCYPHFGSSLFVVNGRLYVAGGYDSITTDKRPCGNPAPVEVYDVDNNKWSVIGQNHIPQNNLGAVEIEGRVYFIVNTFPIDSGIRIPSGEVYPVYLGDWENLRNVANNAALCYVPLKRDSIKGDLE